MWLHTYGKRRSCMRGDEHSDFWKRKGNRRNESGFFWANWVWEADTNIRRKGKEQNERVWEDRKEETHRGGHA